MHIPIQIDKSWSLFLDRDGVINKRIIDGYVGTIDEMEILPGVLNAIERFSKQFNRVFIVTNQQGIGKGLMTHKQLETVHEHLLSQIENTGGKIDAIYYAPNLAAENNPMRKPNIGMALKAKEDFPEIDISKSIMIGDSISDMQFGKNAGMQTIFIGNKKNEWTDFYANSLAEISFTL